MSQTRAQYTFRPPPELDAQLTEYCKRERRGSVNEALVVLVADALSAWQESRQYNDSLGRLGPCVITRGPRELGYDY